ncbi:winged helix-turn-helix domain-containing tetratricopeptide repeat protein [Variovorax sp. GT1P44]|uniref:winged helix-turn-helix domain-containing tetratricopeptide repeat protein n=1 Tax=Variovorax sp. GT1P44 TaxID=3443742 RepID=UPI003F476CCA
MNDEQSTIHLRAPPAFTRSRASVSAVVRFLDFEFDFERDQLRREGALIALSPKPSALLRYFLANPQRLISKAELMESLWAGVVVTDDSLVQCVSELRSRLGAPGAKLITTLPRRGYMFEADVRPVMADGSSDSWRAAEAPPAAPPALSARHGMRRLVAASVALVLLVAGGLAAYREFVSTPFRIDEEVARRNAVVMMPFSDIGATPAPANVRDGLEDEIAARLSELPGASVVRSAEAKGGRYAMSGRIATHRDHVSVDTQLKTIPQGNIVWSEHFEYTDANDPGLNLDVALRVVSSLRHRLTEIHKARVSAPGYRFDPADLAISGWDDINHRQSIEDVRRGRKRFEEALRADPDSVIALTGLGAALMSERFGNSGEPLPQDAAESERVAARAIAVAPNDSVALIIWGDALLFRGQPDLALPVFEKSVLRSPANANAHLRYADNLLLVGRAADMQPEIDSAMRIGYRDQRIMAAAFYVASEAAFALGDDQRAYALARRSLAERPTYGLSYAMLASIDALHGRKEEAEKNMAEHRRLMAHNTIARYVTNHPAGADSYKASRDRMCAGLRAAGLPEQ